jgi:sialate O-acetylesterase
MMRIFIVGLLVAAMAGNAGALELNRYFADNMVIQRDKPLVINGTAENGAEVGVSFMGQTKSAKADDQGVWRVTLDPVAASAKGAKLTVSSKGKTVSVDNVVVGDVILHARQTNIDISLGRDEAGRTAAAAHKQSPLLRAIAIKAIPSAKPLNRLVRMRRPAGRLLIKRPP